MQHVPTEWIEIGSYIRTSRNKSAPLTAHSLHGRHRPTSHLTQSELAQLADVSTVLISKLEQGQYENINPGIVTKVADALHLSEDEKLYLTSLLAPTPPPPCGNDTVPTWVQQSISALQHPAAIVNPCFDILSWNTRLSAFLGDLTTVPQQERNVVKVVFLDPGMRSMFQDWEGNARVMVSGLKMIYSLVPPYRGRINALVTEMCERDDVFATMWAEVRPKLSTRVDKKVLHPALAELDIIEMVTQIVGEPFLSRVEFIPATDESREKMAVLANMRQN